MNPAIEIISIINSACLRKPPKVWSDAIQKKLQIYHLPTGIPARRQHAN